MDGSRDRLLVVWLVLTVAACEPTPVVTQGPSGPTATSTATATPSNTAPPTPIPTTTPAPPTSIDLPPGFDAIPWAHLPDGDGNEDTFTVSIGVLGKPATTTRSFPSQPTVWANGPAVLLEVDGVTEIVDAATGQTIATYDMDDLELAGVPQNDLNYFLFGGGFKADVLRGYLYLMSANRDGMQLRRFSLDGSNQTLLAVVAPDPGRQPWHSDFVITDTGEVIATACPIDREVVPEFRCRIYQAAPGGGPPLAPRMLPAKASRPCGLMAADERWLVGTSYESCRADGGYPLLIPYVAIDRSTLKTFKVVGPSDLRPFGVQGELEPELVANLLSSHPFPRVYRAIGVILRAWDPFYPMDRYYPDAADPGESGDTGEYEGYVWAIRGRGTGWTLVHGFGPEYVACAVGSGHLEQGATNADCPSGPEILETTEGSFILPPGTWGEHVPPLDLPAL